MSKFKVDIVGIDSNNLKVLSNKQMNELFVRLNNGEAHAKEEIINGNLKLVLSITQKFRYKGLDMNDLFQAGCIGLIKAVDNFDLSYGVMFSTYAVPLILGEVKRLVRTNGSIRVARSIRDLAMRIIKFKEEYGILYGYEPTYDIIARELKTEPYEIKLALDSMCEAVSIYEPIYNDGGDTIYLLDQISDAKDKRVDKDMLIALELALNKIKPREREILLSRYVYGKTQSEIAKSAGVSQAQISRLEKSAIKNMKKLLD